MTNTKDFLSRITNIYNTGAATEHSYRSCFESLFESLSKNITALNEPKDGLK